ncbi:hypothetical protein ACJX0J_039906, partial [Zea mays]
MINIYGRRGWIQDVSNASALIENENFLEAQTGVAGIYLSIYIFFTIKKEAVKGNIGWLGGIFFLDWVTFNRPFCEQFLNLFNTTRILIYLFAEQLRENGIFFLVFSTLIILSSLGQVIVVYFILLIFDIRNSCFHYKKIYIMIHILNQIIRLGSNCA